MKMPWTDYKLKLQMAETPDEIQKAIVESLIVLLDAAQARTDMQAKQPLSAKQAKAWVEKNCKFAQKK